MATISKPGVNPPAVNAGDVPKENPAASGEPSSRGSSRPSSPTSTTPPRLADLALRSASAVSVAPRSAAVEARRALESVSRADSPTGPEFAMQAMGRSRSRRLPDNTRSENASASAVRAPQQSWAARLVSYPHTSPGIETAASALAGGAALFPAKAKAFSLASGLVWAGSGIAGIAANTTRDAVTYAANSATFVAGGMQALGQALNGNAKRFADTTSAVVWAGSGGGKIAKALHNFHNNNGRRVVNLAEGVSGVFNLGGATASIATVALGGNSSRAGPAQIASAALWALGTGMQHLAEYAKHRNSATPVNNQATSPRTLPPSRSATPPDRPAVPASSPAGASPSRASTSGANRSPSPAGSKAAGPTKRPASVRSRSSSIDKVAE
jgi:hypothetical protein